jgi:hypothetical protein
MAFWMIANSNRCCLRYTHTPRLDRDAYGPFDGPQTLLRLHPFHGGLRVHPKDRRGTAQRVARLYFHGRLFEPCDEIRVSGKRAHRTGRRRRRTSCHLNPVLTPNTVVREETSFGNAHACVWLSFEFCVSVCVVTHTLYIFWGGGPRTCRPPP